jgi:hypothetical protein
MKNNLIFGILLLLILPVVYGIQVNSTTEIYTFEVTDCQVNDSSMGCSPESVRFSCNITPYTYIDWVQFRINDTDYTTSRSSEIFYYDFYKPQTTSDIDTYLEFDRGKIRDVSSGDALFFPNVSVHLVCDSCNYNITYGDCLINDTREVEYIGDGSGNCTSYNTTESCDYCTPDWEVVSECLENNTEFRQYEDNNICYNLTGLYSDSCDSSFIDCDTWKPCSFLTDELDCEYDVNPLINIIGDKIYWKCSMDNTSLDYNCVSYVKQQNSIIQTNPQQETYSSGIFARKQETREFFTADNGLVNPYFTTTNLKPNITYVFGVECSYEGGNMKTEQYVTPLYKNLEGVAYTTLWLKDNIGYMVGGIILVILLIVGVFAIWGERK